jgi:hypothetical protein
MLSEITLSGILYRKPKLQTRINPISHCSDTNNADKLTRQYLTVAKISVMLYNDVLICGIYGWLVLFSSIILLANFHSDLL